MKINGKELMNKLRSLIRALAVTLATTFFFCFAAWIGINYPAYQLTQVGAWGYIGLAIVSPIFGIVLACWDYQEQKKAKRDN